MDAFQSIAHVSAVSRARYEGIDELRDIPAVVDPFCPRCNAPLDSMMEMKPHHFMELKSVLMPDTRRSTTASTQMVIAEHLMSDAVEGSYSDAYQSDYKRYRKCETLTWNAMFTDSDGVNVYKVNGSSAYPVVHKWVMEISKHIAASERPKLMKAIKERDEIYNENVKCKDVCCTITEGNDEPSSNTPTCIVCYHPFHTKRIAHQPYAFKVSNHLSFSSAIQSLRSYVYGCACVISRSVAISSADRASSRSWIPSAGITTNNI